MQRNRAANAPDCGAAGKLGSAPLAQRAVGVRRQPRCVLDQSFRSRGIPVRVVADARTCAAPSRFTPPARRVRKRVRSYRGTREDRRGRFRFVVILRLHGDDKTAALHRARIRVDVGVVHQRAAEHPGDETG